MSLNIGDRVVVKQPGENKLSPLLQPYPHHIISKKGIMLTAKHMPTNHGITRNQTHFKSIPETAIIPKKEEVEQELEQETDLEGAGEVVECENEALRHNRSRGDDSQRKSVSGTKQPSHT